MYRELERMWKKVVLLFFQESARKDLVTQSQHPQSEKTVLRHGFESRVFRIQVRHIKPVNFSRKLHKNV